MILADLMELYHSPHVPSTVSWVTVLVVESTGTPLRVLLGGLLVVDGRGRSDGSESGESNNGGLEHFRL
jgi:hypothetical protein